MRPDDTTELWARHLDGDRLDAGEQQALLDALRESSDEHRSFLDDEKTDGALLALGRARSDGARFAEKLMLRLRFEADGRAFSERVVSGLGRRARGRRRFPWTVAAAAAAVVLVAGGVWWGLTNATRGIRNAKGVGALRSGSGRVERGTAVASITESQGGVWAYGKMGAHELKKGDELRVGARIETGKGEAAKLAYSDGIRLRIAGNSRFEIRDRKLAHLEIGSIAFEVGKQKPVQPFVVLTPQARIEVKGTRFVVGVEEASTRLAVLEGVVGIERLKDGKSIDVAPGQCAVAGEGVELVALPLSVSERRSAEQALAKSGPMRSRYGAVLFEDEFDGTLANWDVIVGGSGSQARVLTDHASCARLEKNLRHVQSRPNPEKSAIVLESCLVLDPEMAPCEYVAIRSKKPIEAERFVVELGCVFASTGAKQRSFVEAFGLEALESNMTDTGERVNKPQVEYGPIYVEHRWEFRPASDGRLHCRMFRGRGTSGFFRSCYMKPESRRMRFGVQGSGWRMIINWVRVREILDDDVAAGVRQ